VARKRKTEAEKRQERDDAKQRAAISFFPRLRQAATVAEAGALAVAAPAPDSPGRLLHTNLMFFLTALRPPGMASYAENAEYIALARRFVAGGEMKTETLEQIERDFSPVMDRQGPFG
jgi:hypothetical protein